MFDTETEYNDVSNKLPLLQLTLAGNSMVSTPGPANNEIWYTSTDENIVTLNKTNVFGANIVSNTYTNGKGIILFDGDVTSICDYAFRGCTGLTSITIGNSVTSIGGYTFDGCTGLTSITSLNPTPPTLGSSTFYDAPSTCPIYVPAASVDAYKSAANWSERAAYIQAIPS